jgi:hypothetical protein
MTCDTQDHLTLVADRAAEKLAPVITMMEISQGSAATLYPLMLDELLPKRAILVGTAGLVTAAETGLGQFPISRSHLPGTAAEQADIRRDQARAATSEVAASSQEQPR